MGRPDTKKLNTIQKRGNLHEILSLDPAGTGNASHRYGIYEDGAHDDQKTPAHVIAVIQFQEGARGEPGSMEGVLDVDLLEIVRDRLKAFQTGSYACKFNENALQHIEEALFWMNRRVEDRIDRNVLGTHKV